MTASVVSDDAKSAFAQKHHLVVPSLRVQRPAMREYNGTSRSPVLVEYLRTVLGSDGAHAMLLRLLPSTTELPADGLRRNMANLSLYFL